MAGAKKDSKKKSKNPTSLEEIAANIQSQRTYVTCGPDENRHTAEHQYSGAYASMGIDNTFTMESFRENFKMWITHMDDEKVVFEMSGISPAIANAFRRILIAEVPTMAIEKVYMVNNTSIIQDEVFAHRLGLVPIRADPRLFEYKAEGETYNERNTIVFKMNVRCYREKTDDGSKGPLMNQHVYTNELVWLPKGSELPPDEESKFTAFTQSQAEYLKEKNDESSGERGGRGRGGYTAVRRKRSQRDRHRQRRHPAVQDGRRAGDRARGALHERTRQGTRQVVAGGHHVVQDGAQD